MSEKDLGRMVERAGPAGIADQTGRTVRRARIDAPSVLDTLRADIIALRLKPGEVLSRQELQLRFGLSSTPVRDALLRLQEDGLVDIFPQHATRVSPIDLTLARQAQFLRRSLEIECVRQLASRPDAALIGQLESLIRQQMAFDLVGELEAFSAADHAFHRALFDAAGVLDLWHLMRRQSGHIDRLRRLHLPVKGKTGEILSFHRAIVERIGAGDAEGAAEAMREHLSRSLGFVDTLRDQYPDYFRD